QPNITCFLPNCNRCDCTSSTAGASFRTVCPTWTVLLVESDMSGFDVFYGDNVRLVYAMALARGVGPTCAEDLAQETFLRAWRHFELLCGMEPIARRAWLVRVLRNLAADDYRRRKAADRAEVARLEETPSD